MSRKTKHPREQEEIPSEEQSPEHTWEDLADRALTFIFKMIMWMAIAWGVGWLLAAFFIPKIVNNCSEGEGPLDCYWRIEAEKEKLGKFEDCQRTCGRGIGNDVCLERCEYQYGVGKWKYANTYTTKAGKSFTCPQGEQGYEDRYGKPYCQ